MVAIKSHEADRLLGGDVGRYSAFLIYGSDSGLVSERVRRLVKRLVDDPADPFQLARLSAEDIARDTPRLADEAGTVPLFGGRRAVLCDGGARNMAAAVDLYLATTAPCPVIIEAGALKPEAPLRKAVERSKVAAAIACYPDGEREIAGLIDAEIEAAGLRIEPDAKEFLASLLGADRLATRSEIGKLVLYARGKASIGVEDVEAAVADASALAWDDLIDAAFSGDRDALDATLRKLSLDAGDAGVVTAAALRHAVMLHRSKLGGGDGPPQGRGLSPRRRMVVEQQGRTWSTDALGRTVVRLGETLGLVRRDPRLARDHAIRALWAIAAAARPSSTRTPLARP